MAIFKALVLQFFVLHLATLIHLTVDCRITSYLTNGTIAKLLIGRSLMHSSLIDKYKLFKNLPINFLVESKKSGEFEPNNQIKSEKTIPTYLIRNDMEKNQLNNFILESTKFAQYVDVKNYHISPNHLISNNVYNDKQTSIGNKDINAHPMNSMDESQVTIIKDNIDIDPNIINEDRVLAKRLDVNINLIRKLGRLAGVTSLLSTSQRRISPLNKIILGLLGPKLIKLQLDMMFGAVISELMRKFLMPIIGFVIDKNLPNVMQSTQVPNYSNQLEQLQNTYLTSSPNTTSASQNYLNHPSYLSSYTTTPSTTLDTYYGQALLSNYLASQPQYTKSHLSSVDNQQVRTSSLGNSQQNAQGSQQLNQITIQQLNQLLNQLANLINSQTVQQSIPQPVMLNSQLQAQLNGQPIDQNNQIYAELKNLILEQVKLKNQLQELAKPKNYFAKDMELDNQFKEEQIDEDLKGASLNQIEQEYERAQRWNTVLKNMDQFYSNNITSSVER